MLYVHVFFVNFGFLFCFFRGKGVNPYIYEKHYITFGNNKPPYSVFLYCDGITPYLSLKYFEK